MNRVQRRNIYIVDLDLVVHSVGSPIAFAKQCQLSKFSAVWVRLGRGTNLGGNFSFAEYAQVRTELANVGVGFWGWHVPQCLNQQAAVAESSLVIQWAGTYALDGVLIDAEQDQPGEHNYFLGGANEAQIYSHTLQQAFNASGKGLALSSHDQPHLHQGFPFKKFLDEVADNCPQVYYSTQPVTNRLNPSIADYQALENPVSFTGRYKPVGNITVFDDVPLKSADDCVQKTLDFIAAVHANGFGGYSFWCWDEAPSALWKTLHTTPV